MSIKRQAVFLDRDGTINIEKDYLHRIEDFEFIPGVPEVIKKIKDAGFLVIVVSNQSGIARGYFDEESVDRLHEHIQHQLQRYGTAIDEFYYCPHHPETGSGKYKVSCDCRKGAPGMLFQASTDLGIDLRRSFMIGDKVADIEAGENAGCQPILVLTGYGQESRLRIDENRAIICEDLVSAAGVILDNKKFK